MRTDMQGESEKEDKPLTRTDVERLLDEVGSPDKLYLTRENLEGINLSYFGLDNAHLSEADLSSADLREAGLRDADLSGADLSSADLTYAHMGGAKLTNATLTNATLRGANLFSADLRGAKLTNATLTNTTLALANLSGADLTGADLSSVNLLGAANLSGVKMGEVEMRPIIIPQSPKEQLHDSGAIGLSEPMQAMEYVPTIRIRILEEPLTAQNLTTILSALTELHTKCWLIAGSRLSDLIEYTQTHNPRFSEEAHLIIEQMAHHSPLELKLNPGVKELAEALEVGIDAVSQAHIRYKGAQLENEAQSLANQAAVLKMKLDELEALSSLRDQEQAHQIEAQQAELDRQKALLEIQKQQLEIEQQQVALQRAMLESEHQRVNLAFETASKIVERIAPAADETSKAMLIQSLLPQLLQLANGKGLELALPAPQSSEEKIETKQNE